MGKGAALSEFPMFIQECADLHILEFLRKNPTVSENLTVGFQI